MKRLLVLAILSVFAISVTGCSADNINKVIDIVGEESGVDIDVEVEQEQVDKIADELDKFKDTAENIVEDEDVRDALKDLFNAVQDASKETSTESDSTELEP